MRFLSWGAELLELLSQIFQKIELDSRSKRFARRGCRFLILFYVWGRSASDISLILTAL